MKYLTYFRPNKDLSNLILNQNDIALPSSGLHSTLCFFHMENKQEDELISDLSKIKYDPFEVEIQEFDDFDKDSLVLKLSQPDELLQLHKNIVLAVKKHASLGFDKIAKYYGDKYNPHITISKSLSDFDRNSKKLFYQKDLISKYHLSKKVDGNWKEIQTFYSRE